MAADSTGLSFEVSKRSRRPERSWEDGTGGGRQVGGGALGHSWGGTCEPLSLT